MELILPGRGPSGIIRAWERPRSMSVRDFLALPPDRMHAVLGDPVAEGSNMLTNNWWSDVFTTMGGGAAQIQVAVLALGTGSMAGLPTRVDAAMVSEWKRYLLVAYSVGVVDPIVGTFSFFAPASDGAASITEAGLWHGSATTTAGSGRMSTHAAWTYSKSASTDARLDYAITRPTT